MDTHTFSLERPLTYHWCGKFEAPNTEWMHLHRILTDYELMVVTDGCLYIADDTKKYIVPAGEYLLMAPGQEQYGYQASACTFYWLHFAGQTPDVPGNKPEKEVPEKEAINMEITLPRQHPLPHLERIIILFKQMQDNERRYHHSLSNHYHATGILTELYNQYKDTAAGGTLRTREQLYTDITDYISWHICEPVRVSEIAGYYGYNEKYLTTFFKRMSGIPLKTYILNEKINRAKSLLADTNDTVAQIGYNLGFSDNHNFSSCFKRITGLTPTEYRASFAKRMLFHE